MTVPADPPVRLTLTFAALNRAANAYFLVTGSNKARALHDILAGTADPNSVSGRRRPARIGHVDLVGRWRRDPAAS